MVNAQLAADLLSKVGKIGPQPGSDWSGKTDLPLAVAQFYEEVGPLNVRIKLPGNPLTIPRLSALWKVQQGYGFGLRGELLEGWNLRWLMVADASGEGLAFDSSTERILFVTPGDGEWTATPLFENLNAMAAGLGLVASLLKKGVDGPEIASALSDLLETDLANSEAILAELGISAS